MPYMRRRPDGGTNIEYGNWGYFGPRWWFDDPATGFSHYADEDHESHIRAAAKRRGITVVDLESLYAKPTDPKEPSDD